MKTKKQRKQFLDDNFKLSTLNFKCSKNYVVRIYNLRDEKTQFCAGGGGYDKYGTCLGQLINHYFNNEIKKLNTSDFYGLTHWNKKTKKEALKILNLMWMVLVDLIQCKKYWIKLALNCNLFMNQIIAQCIKCQ